MFGFKRVIAYLLLASLIAFQSSAWELDSFEDVETALSDRNPPTSGFPNSLNSTEHERHNATGFILGGQAAHPQEFPMFVSIRGRNNFCGGSLLAPDVVLTGAHCTWGQRGVDFTIQTTTGFRVRTNGLRIHESYQPSGFSHDVALLALSRPVRVAHYARVARRQMVPGERVVLIGKGGTERQKFSNEVRKVGSTILEANMCEGLDYPFDPNSMLCVDGRFGRSANSGKTVL
jgi:hypothetical protein